MDKAPAINADRSARIGSHCAWRWLRVVVLIAATSVLVVLVAGLFLGRWLEGPAQPPSKADVIVLLGGDSRARLVAGVDLYQRGMAPIVYLAGSDSERLPPGHSLPNLRLQYLLDEGVPRDAILIDDFSFNSWEEANSALALMRQAGWHKALVVSDPPHMRRLSWIWRRVFAGADASFVLVSSRPRWWRSSEWWRDEWAGQFVISEVIKIGYYFTVR